MANKDGTETLTSIGTKFQGMWSAIRTMSTAWEDQNATGTQLTKWKKAVEVDLETAYNTVFGKCTTGDSASVHTAAGQSYTQSRECERVVPASPSRVKEEYFYSQFLQDERQRAVQAVNHLQKTKPHNSASTSTPDRSIPKPFPVSSPSNKVTNSFVVPSSVTQPISSSPVKAPVVSNMSFDDGISAISAHTLDEMVRLSDVAKSQRLGPVRSDLTSEDFALGSMSHEESALFPVLTPRREGPETTNHLSPHGLSKRRSFGTHASQRSKGNRSMQTKSTQSTQSSHFESLWRKDEQRYWENAVDEGDHDPNDMIPQANQLRVRSRESVSSIYFRYCWCYGLTSRLRFADHNIRFLSILIKHCQKMYRNDGTITTTSSSAHSSLSRQHPHDTFPVYAGDFVTRKSGYLDPDRIEHFLILEDDTEIGEI